MPATHVETEAPFSELELPDSCPCCDGPLALRVLDTSAWAVCLPCQSFSRFEVADSGRELALTPLLIAEA